MFSSVSGSKIHFFSASRRKAGLTAVLLLLCIILFCLSVSQTEDRYDYGSLRISGEKLQQLTAGRTKSTRPILREISFDHMPLIYDELGKRWFYTISPEAGTGDVTVSYSAEKPNAGVAFAGDLIPGSSVRMIAYTDDEYEISGIEISTIPFMQIDCESEPTAIWKDPLPIRFTLYDNRTETRQPIIKSDGTIHVRGNTAQFHPKKPYRIALTTKSIGGIQKENPTSLLGMRKDGDWILYPAYNDQEKIRNVFSSNLWFNSCAGNNSFGMNNGMEYRYVELFMNHRYWGLYAVGYPIDAKQMGIMPERNGHYEEFLFKQKAWGPTDRNYYDIGNFLMSVIKMIKPDENYGLSIMEMYFEDIYTGCRNGMYNYDEINAIDMWLFTKMLQGTDCINHPGQINNIIYTIKTTNNERKLIYTPWDMDATWGNESGLVSIAYRMAPTDNSMEMTMNPVSVLMNKDTGLRLRGKIKERYFELRKEYWSDQVMDALIDGFEQDIYGSGAYARDAERWPHGGYQDPELGLSLFRTYVHERLRSLDQYIGDL